MAIYLINYKYNNNMALHLINFKSNVAKQQKEGYCFTELSDSNYELRKKQYLIDDSNSVFPYSHYIKMEIQESVEDSISTAFTDLVITNIVRI